MSEPLPLEVTRLATRQIETAEEWWRENRTAAPNLIREELSRAFALITAQPRIGSRATHVRLPGVRRIFLPRVRYHVYYHLLSAPDRIEVVAFWSSWRGKGPPV